ncbi:MAG: OmpA family protein [Salinibacter sp.]
MRLAFLAFVVPLVLFGCQGGESRGLRDRVDSLQAANRSLERRVQALRDSLRGATAAETTTLSPPVYFPSGSAWLFNEAKRRLDQHARTLQQRYPNADFRIKGYTDNVPIGPSLRDTYPSNWYLSAQRAAAVAHYLDTEHGVRTQTLEIEAFGPTSPVAPNETPKGRRQNRRVEIVIEGGS